MMDSPFEFSKYVNLPHFKSELENGLYFESNIPNGYGIGSSGALCAAIIDHFKTPELDDSNHILLQSVLAQIENYFHGTSSGLDPMVSYLQKPIVVNGPGSISILDAAGISNKMNIYLIDSGKPRKTEPLVDLFIDLTTDNTFKQNIENEFSSLVNECIDLWINNNENVFNAIKSLSHMQFKYFQDFITDNVRTVWEESLNNDKIAIKLCGAGGGGYFLLFAKEAFMGDIGLPVIKI
jgi:mevalonate kinase